VIAVALPKQVVDQLRTERGSIVDTAIEMGRIVIVDQKVCEQHESDSRKN
jgi:antitoxin component of MazEF toxin-antitoxin module